MGKDVRVHAVIAGRVQGVFLDWRPNAKQKDTVFSGG